MSIFTPDEVAEHFKLTRDFVIRKALGNVWPHQKHGKRTIRFTAENIAQIEQLVSVNPLANVTNLHGHRGRRSS
jgi:hypothetical protein